MTARYATPLRVMACRHMLAAATMLGRHQSAPLSLIGRLVLGDANFLRDVEVGAARGRCPNFGIERYDRLMGGLSWVWPDDLPWPSSVPRPAPFLIPPERAATARERLGRPR